MNIYIANKKFQFKFIFIKMLYFWGSISHNLVDWDKIKNMNNANQYIVNQSQLTNFVSISKQKKCRIKWHFLQCALSTFENKRITCECNKQTLSYFTFDISHVLFKSLYASLLFWLCIYDPTCLKRPAKILETSTVEEKISWKFKDDDNIARAGIWYVDFV